MLRSFRFVRQAGVGLSLSVRQDKTCFLVEILLWAWACLGCCNKILDGAFFGRETSSLY